MPCLNEGWEHANAVEIEGEKWYLRRVKEMPKDFGMCSQKINCKRCKAERKKQKAALTAFKAQHDRNDPDQVAQLKEMKERYVIST